MSFKKVWNFIWHGDTPTSWVLAIVLAFLLVKFILYPGIGIVLGTTHPIVAVVSWSMEHSVNNNKLCGMYPTTFESGFDNYWEVCGDWYEQEGISKFEFSKFKFKNGFNQGDIMIVLGKETKDINIGDTLIFQSTSNYPIIHRVVKKWELEGSHYFKTKGDYNPGSHSQLGEDMIGKDRIVGVAVLRVPYLGWIKLTFNNLFVKMKEIYNMFKT